MRSQRTLVVAVMLVALAVESSGCCIIGAGIGAAIDRRKPPLIVPPEGWGSIQPGTKVDAHLRDGTCIGYRFRGVVADSTAPADSTFSKRLPAAIPVDSGVPNRGLLWTTWATTSKPLSVPRERIELLTTPDGHTTTIALAAFGLCLDITAVVVALSIRDALDQMTFFEVR